MKEAGAYNHYFYSTWILALASFSVIWRKMKYFSFVNAIN